MKIECLREYLLRAVSNAERVTGKKLPLPVLSKVLIEATEKDLYIRSTNLDLGFELKIPCKVYKSGRVSVSGSVIENYLANLPSQTTVSLEKTNNNLLVSSTTSTALIACENAEEFPVLPKFGKEKVGNITIDSSSFLSGLRSVFYAAATSDIKPELGSVFVRTEEGEVIFAATDSFRLAEKKVQAKKVVGEGDNQMNILIPLKNILEINRILSEVEGQISICFSKNQVSLETSNIYITSRLVEGNFPAYNHLIPKSFTTQVVVLREDLFEATRLVNVFSDRFHQIGLKIIPEDQLFELFSRNQEVGEGTVKVDATIEGENIDTLLNSRYLIDCLTSINKDSVTIGLNGRSKAILIRAVGDRSFNYLVMPLHQ